MVQTERWNQLLSKIREEQGIAGLVVAVTDRSKLIYCGCFGSESLERPEIVPSAYSMHRIASISKVITGITVFRLQAEGLLDVDEPVKTYLPWLKMSREHAAERLTLRHLLSHTAGLPAEYSPVGAREESATLREVQQALPTLPMGAMPGEGAFLYSNWGFRTIACVIQAVTGMWFSEAAQKYALEPLGMNKTTYDLRVAATYPMSLPHEPGPDGTLQVLHYIRENAARLATGGLFSSAEQLGILARFLMNGGKNDDGVQVLRPESLREMMQPAAVSNGGGYDRYGLSMMMMDLEDQVLYGHMGSAPPYMSSVFTHPESGFGVITLMNTNRPQLREDIPKLILRDLIV